MISLPGTLPSVLVLQGLCQVSGTCPGGNTINKKLDIVRRPRKKRVNVSLAAFGSKFDSMRLLGIFAHETQQKLLSQEGTCASVHRISLPGTWAVDRKSGVARARKVPPPPTTRLHRGFRSCKILKSSTLSAARTQLLHSAVMLRV